VLKSLVTVSHWTQESFVVVLENPAVDRQEIITDRIIFFIALTHVHLIVYK
jgi:hypothetical protein